MYRYLILIESIPKLDIIIVLVYFACGAIERLINAKYIYKYYIDYTPTVSCKDLSRSIAPQKWNYNIPELYHDLKLVPSWW